MDIKRAKKEIRDTIAAYLAQDEYGEYVIPVIRQRPILLMGPPGVGKTQIMEQIALECRIGLVSYTITHHTRQSAVGLPFIREKTYQGKTYSVTEYTMSEIIGAVYEHIERTGIKEGILFIDEINCVSETLAPMMLQFLQCKTFGNQKVPKGWIIVAAGNPPEYNKSVREFDIVTLDRIKRIDVEENYGIWKEYAYQAGIHPAIISYLELRRDNFYRIETGVDGKLFVTARGWEDLSQFLRAYEAIGRKADREVVHQYLQHWKIAKDFSNYLELFEKYKKDYGLERIVEGHYGKDTLEQLKFASFDERLSVVGLLIGKLSEIFQDCYTKDAYVTKLYDYLIMYKQSDKELHDIVQQAALDYQNLRRAEQLSRLEDYIFRKVTDTLEQYQMLLSEEHLAGSEAWGHISKEFRKETEDREEKLRKALSSLDFVFDFMEDAFGDSQEMVSFVTELNTGFYSIWFLKENDCDKYYKYNKRLLFDEQHEEILSELSEIESEIS